MGKRIHRLSETKKYRKQIARSAKRIAVNLMRQSQIAITTSKKTGSLINNEKKPYAQRRNVLINKELKLIDSILIKFKESRDRLNAELLRLKKEDYSKGIPRSKKVIAMELLAILEGEETAYLKYNQKTRLEWIGEERKRILKFLRRPEK